MARSSIFSFIILLLISWTGAHAQIIRDTEIESGLRNYSYPIIRSAGLDTRSVRLHILNRDSLNAFVAGGQNIFINSGTLIAAESADEVLAVLAHEVGHIAGGHLVSLHAQVKASSRTALLSLLVSVPLAILAGDSRAAIGGGIAGQSIARAQLSNYTQDMESSADQAGLGYLEQQNINAQGMVDFLRRLKNLERIYGDRSAYLRSHPLTDSRIKFAEYALQNNQELETAPKIFSFIQTRIRAKLIGHLWEYDRVIKKFPPTDKTIEALYARTFSYMLKGKHDEALAEIDTLLAKNPNDIFYLEAKGDVYRNAGQMSDARKYYSQALEAAPWAALIHSQWANSLSFDERKSPNLVKIALAHADKAVKLEPRLYSAWFAKAAMEAAQGKNLLADVSGAEASLLRGDVERALFLANRAANALPEGSKDKGRALDIINTSSQIKADRKN